MDRANYELAKYLAERREGEVHLIAHRVSEPLRSMPGVMVHLVPRPARSYLLGGILIDRFGRKVARSLRTKSPYVVMNGGNCRWPGVNWVHYVHAKCLCQSTGAPWRFRLKNRIARALGVRHERSAFASSRLFIANSEKTRRDLIEMYGVPPDKIHRVYLGVDESSFLSITPEERSAARREFQLADSDRMILFVGALGYDRNKGLDTLLSGFQLLSAPARGRNYLFAVGSGKLKYWQQLVNESGAADRVRLLGARTDVPRLMAAADLLVSPTRYDSYGLAVHEALCRGLPVIVAKTAGVAERIPYDLNGMVLPNPEDAGDLARRIDTVLSGRPRIQPMLDTLGETLRSWSWRDMAQEMVRVIESD